jgi:hypothetical protein
VIVCNHKRGGCKCLEKALAEARRTGAARLEIKTRSGVLVLERTPVEAAPVGELRVTPCVLRGKP